MTGDGVLEVFHDCASLLAKERHRHGNIPRLSGSMTVLVQPLSNVDSMVRTPSTFASPPSQNINIAYSYGKEKIITCQHLLRKNEKIHFYYNMMWTNAKFVQKGTSIY